MLVDIATLYGKLIKERFSTQSIKITIKDLDTDKEVTYTLTEYGEKLLNEMGDEIFTDFLNNLMVLDDQYNLRKILK